MMKLVFLGTGGSYPSPKRNVLSIAVKYQSEVILFDCGEGTQRQLMRSSLSFMDVDKIFITHFHGDHFLGLPGLIQSMKLNDRDTPLYIYGPEGTCSVVKGLLELGYFNPSFEVKVQDIQPGALLKFKYFSIKSFRVDHNVPSLGYKFKENDRPGRFDKPKALSLGIPEGPLFGRLQRGGSVEIDGGIISPKDVLGPPRKGRTIVYSGDTRPCAEVAQAAENADFLIHEGTMDSTLSEKANEYGHTSVDQAANIAKKADVDRLFLVHISPRYEEVSELLKTAREEFPNTTIPRDLESFEL